MKEPRWESCTEEQLWRYVGFHLAKSGIKTMLVGGAVAAIYSEGVYQSLDLDLIDMSYHQKSIADVMKNTIHIPAANFLWNL